MSDVNPEAVACSKLREYLLQYLPGKVDDLNALRFGTLRSASPGPWEILPFATLYLGTSRTGTLTAVTLPEGPAIAANAIALVINTAALGITAFADADGRLVLQSSTSVYSEPSAVVVGNGGSGNSVFGWPVEGCYDVKSVIGTPTWNSIMDGWPVSVPDAKTMAFILGDRDVTPLGGFRRDEYLVTIDCSIWNVDPAAQGHRTREAIQTCVQAVREVLESDDGRRLGDNTGVIQHLEIGRVRVRGIPFSAFDEQRRLLGPPSDVASMQVRVKVFARPDAAP